MAKLRTPFEFTGSLGGLSAYTMRGVDRVILRRKGGPSKRAFRNSPGMVRTRENAMEFGGRSRAAKFIMASMLRLRPLGDYNIAGPLNALARRIQKLSPGIRGQRGIQLSSYPDLLAGFSLNRGVIFESIVRVPLAHTIDETTLRAEVTIPALIPGVNFHPDRRQSMYRFIVSLGIVPDVYYDIGKGQYEPDYVESAAVHHETPWRHVSKTTDPITVGLQQVARLGISRPYTLVLGIGICYGTPDGEGGFGQVRYAGTAKIIDCRAVPAAGDES